MAFICNDRVKETTATTGTGTITLAGAVTHFEAFSAIGNTNTTYYCIVHENTSYDEWEVGYGVYTSSGTTLTRTAVTSSNGDALVSFTAGTKSVFCTLPAEKGVIKDTSGNLIYGDGTATGFMTDLVDDTTPQLGGDLDVNGNAIVSASDGDIAINANGTGMVTMTANSVTGDVIPGKYAGTNFTGSLLVGHSTTGTLSTASNNTAVGLETLKRITTGDNNTMVGYNAGQSILGGRHNTGLGREAANGVNSGKYNICVGYQSGQTISSGDGNVIIGAAVEPPSGTGDRQLLIAGQDDSTTTTWITGESTGNTEIAVNWNPSLSTTGKAFVMGF